MRILLALPDRLGGLTGLIDAISTEQPACAHGSMFHRVHSPEEARQALLPCACFSVLVLCLSAQSAGKIARWQFLAEDAGVPLVLVGDDARAVAAAALIVKPTVSLVLGESMTPAAIRGLLRAIRTREGDGRPERHREQSESVIRLKTNFMAALSHELRTPLNAIIGFSDIMLEALFGEIGIARYKDYVADINRSGKALLRTIEDLQFLVATSGMISCEDSGCRIGRDIRSFIAERGEAFADIAELSGSIRRMRQVERISNHEDGFRRLIDSVSDAVLVLDEVGIIEKANPGAERLFACSRQALLDRVLPSLFALDEETSFDATHGEWPIRARGVRFDGRHFAARVNYDEFVIDGQSRFLAIIRDADEESRLHTLAYQDQKTGLPNKAFLLEHLGRLTARLEGETFAVVLADIDHYKTLCGMHGEELGTEALARLARRLGHFGSERVLIAHFGNDEFAIVFDGVGDIDHLPLNPLQNVIRTPTQHDGFQVQLTATLGISFYPEDGLEGATLLRHAAAAVRYAKDEPGREPQRFTPAVATRLRERSLLEQGIRLAARRGELSVAYQPKVDLTNGAVIGAEALVRWHSAELGAVSPATFIPVAERGGAIGEIGDWVFDEVCHEMGPYLSDQDGFRVSINLSPRQFLQPRLSKKLTRAMERLGIGGRSIDIEVTEGMLLGADDIIQKNMSDLKDIGLTISLDDFGTCYSSLAYLSRLPLDTIKIDKTFLQRVPHDRGNVAITTAIIAMARGLGLNLVAEGIETTEQRDFLLGHDCRIAQGFLFGRPTPIADFPWSQRPLAIVTTAAH